MQRYILTGAPGAGKTVILRRLELDGFPVVEEAATDLIALVTARGVIEHWREPTFIDDVLALQIARQRRADTWPADTVIFDRSPVCTLALTRFAGREVSPTLAQELARIERERLYERNVFFIQGLGFITPTEARRISLEDALRFEADHVQAYRELGYECVMVPPGSPDERADMVRGMIESG